MRQRQLWSPFSVGSLDQSRRQYGFIGMRYSTGIWRFTPLEGLIGAFSVGMSAPCWPRCFSKAYAVKLHHQSQIIHPCHCQRRRIFPGSCKICDVIIRHLTWIPKRGFQHKLPPRQAILMSTGVSFASMLILAPHGWPLIGADCGVRIKHPRFGSKLVANLKLMRTCSCLSPWS